MDSVTEILFLINLAMLLIGHELDAIYRHEWRFLFQWLPVTDKTAYQLFVVLHVPIFVLVMLGYPLRAFQIGFDIFLILHAGVHWMLGDHPLLQFESWFSRFWIFGGAALGVVHLLLLGFSG